MQQYQINEQETKLIQLRDLQWENERLRKKYQHLRQTHEELRAVYRHQMELIYFLKKFAILQIWKKVFSFLSQQSED